MMLHPDWRRILRQAWSIRLGILAAVLSGIEVALPFFESAIPRNLFAVLSGITAAAAILARLVAQPEMHK